MSERQRWNMCRRRGPPHQIFPAELLQESSEPGMVPGIPGFGAAGSIVRKEIPLDTTPVCCVQYGGVPVNIACNCRCTQDLYARLALTDNRRANSYSKRVQIGGLRVIFRSYAADGPSRAISFAAWLYRACFRLLRAIEMVLPNWCPRKKSDVSRKATCQHRCSPDDSDSTVVLWLAT